MGQQHVRRGACDLGQPVHRDIAGCIAPVQQHQRQCSIPSAAAKRQHVGVVGLQRPVGACVQRRMVALEGDQCAVPMPQGIGVGTL